MSNLKRLQEIKLIKKTLCVLIAASFLLSNLTPPAYPQDKLSPALRTNIEVFKERFLAGEIFAHHEMVNAYIKAQIEKLNSEKALKSITLKPEGLDQGVELIAIPGLLAKTGLFGHVGLGQYYKKPVIYIDEEFYFNDDIRQHEIEEVVKWESLRKILKLDPNQMRGWIIKHIETKTNDATLKEVGYLGLTSREIAKKIHESCHSVEHLSNLREEKIDFVYIYNSLTAYADDDGSSKKQMGSGLETELEGFVYSLNKPLQKAVRECSPVYPMECELMSDVVKRILDAKFKGRIETRMERGEYGPEEGNGHTWLILKDIASGSEYYLSFTDGQFADFPGGDKFNDNAALARWGGKPYAKREYVDWYTKNGYGFVTFRRIEGKGYVREKLNMIADKDQKDREIFFKQLRPRDYDIRLAYIMCEMAPVLKAMNISLKNIAMPIEKYVPELEGTLSDGCLLKGVYTEDIYQGPAEKNIEVLHAARELPARIIGLFYNDRGPEKQGVEVHEGITATLSEDGTYSYDSDFGYNSPPDRFLDISLVSERPMPIESRFEKDVVIAASDSEPIGPEASLEELGKLTRVDYDNYGAIDGEKTFSVDDPELKDITDVIPFFRENVLTPGRISYLAAINGMASSGIDVKDSSRTLLSVGTAADASNIYLGSNPDVAYWADDNALEFHPPNMITRSNDTYIMYRKIPMSMRESLERYAMNKGKQDGKLNLTTMLHDKIYRETIGARISGHTANAFSFKGKILAPLLLELFSLGVTKVTVKQIKGSKTGTRVWKVDFDWKHPNDKAEKHRVLYYIQTDVFKADTGTGLPEFLKEIETPVNVYLEKAFFVPSIDRDEQRVKLLHQGVDSVMSPNAAAIVDGEAGVTENSLAFPGALLSDDKAKYKEVGKSEQVDKLEAEGNKFGYGRVYVYKKTRKEFAEVLAILNKKKGRGLVHAEECFDAIMSLSEKDKKKAKAVLLSFIPKDKKQFEKILDDLKYKLSDEGAISTTDEAKKLSPRYEVLLSKAIVLGFMGVKDRRVIKLLEAGAVFYNKQEMSYGDLSVRDMPEAFADMSIRAASIGALYYLGRNADMENILEYRGLQKAYLDLRNKYNKQESYTPGAKKYGIGLLRYTGMILRQILRKTNRLSLEELSTVLDRAKVISLAASESNGGLEQDVCTSWPLDGQSVEEYIAQRMTTGDFVKLGDNSETSREILFALDNICSPFLVNFGLDVEEVFKGKNVYLIEMPLEKGKPIRHYVKGNDVYIFFPNYEEYLRKDDYNFCKWDRVLKPGTDTMHYDVEPDYISQLMWYGETHTKELHAVAQFDEIRERLAPNFMDAIGAVTGKSADVHEDSMQEDLYSLFVFYLSVPNETYAPDKNGHIQKIIDIINGPGVQRRYFGPFVEPVPVGFKIPGVDEQAVMRALMEKNITACAKQAKSELAKEKKVYTLLLYPGLFARGEFEKEKELYKNDFNMEILEGKDKGLMLSDIIAKAKGKEERSIALVPDIFSQEELLTLKEKGIRFMIINLDSVLDMHKMTGDQSALSFKRRAYQRNVYAMMLAARAIEKGSKNNAVWNVLKYYLKLGFVKKDVPEEAYMEALANINVSCLYASVIAPFQGAHLSVYDLVTKSFIPAGKKGTGSPADCLETIKMNDVKIEPRGNKTLLELAFDRNEGITAAEVHAQRNSFSPRTIDREFEILKDVGVFVPVVIDGKEKRGYYRFADMMIGQNGNIGFTKNLINAINEIEYQVGGKGETIPLKRGDVPMDKRVVVKELIKTVVINEINKAIKPAIPESKVLWHILEQEVIATSQGSWFAQRVNNASRGSTKQERVWILRNGETIEKAIAKIKEICPNAMFDVALSDNSHIKDVPLLKDEEHIRMLVFKGSVGDFAQLEGVIAALRALHLSKQDVMPALLSIYSAIKGSAYKGSIPNISALDDPREFAAKFIFDLPPATSVPANDIPKLNDRMLKILVAA